MWCVQLVNVIQTQLFTACGNGRLLHHIRLRYFTVNRDAGCTIVIYSRIVGQCVCCLKAYCWTYGITHFTIYTSDVNIVLGR